MFVLRKQRHNNDSMRPDSNNDNARTIGEAVESVTTLIPLPEASKIASKTRGPSRRLGILPTTLRNWSCFVVVAIKSTLMKNFLAALISFFSRSGVSKEHLRGSTMINKANDQLKNHSCLCYNTCMSCLWLFLVHETSWLCWKVW